MNNENDVMENIGFTENFIINDYKSAEEKIELLKKIKVSKVRCALFLSDFSDKVNTDWFNWIIPKTALEFELILQIFTDENKTYNETETDILRFVESYSEYAEGIELPFNTEKFYRMDLNERGSYLQFLSSISNKVANNKKIILSGLNSDDHQLLDNLSFNKILQNYHAVIISYSSASKKEREELLKIIEEDKIGIWIEGDFDTQDYDEAGQLTFLDDLLDLNPERVYWGSIKDSGEDYSGLIQKNGLPKLLFRLWSKEGLEKLNDFTELYSIKSNGTKDKIPNLNVIKNNSSPVLIIGGAGFIGTNLAKRYLQEGRPVRIFDNLSRDGVEENLNWLSQKFGGNLQIEIGDIRNRNLVNNIIKNTSQVFNFAAQVAVTTSLIDPVSDMETNIMGTLNILEAMRNQSNPPSLIFTSTNKVYGGLHNLELEVKDDVYTPSDKDLMESGIGENYNLDFHSPYGCSKGAAEQYVLDYSRSYNLQTAVFRMSCIYGPHQFGTEDQGWVAHFILQTLRNKTIVLYGDGRQVRDILYIEDLVDAFLLAQRNISKISGQAFNIGGGADNAVSLKGLLNIIQKISGLTPKHTYNEWRSGDQKYYVSDFSKFKNTVGWQPKVYYLEGIKRLYEWLKDNRISDTRLVLKSSNPNYKVKNKVAAI